MSRNRWAQHSGAWVGAGRHKARGKGSLGHPYSDVGPLCSESFGFLLNSSPQTTILSSRRHNVGREHTPEDWSFDRSSYEGMLGLALEQGFGASLGSRVLFTGELAKARAGSVT